MQYTPQILSLLRLGMGISSIQDEIENLNALSDIQWEEIRKIAKDHTCAALIYEGIIQLPEEKQPSLYWRMKWISSTIKTERHYLALQDTILKIYDLFTANNIRFVLIKGHASAAHYPNPIRRKGGDIDILILDNNFRKACSLLANSGGILTESAPEKHEGYMFGDNIMIELHYLLIDVCSPSAIKYLKNVDYTDKITTLEIGNHPIPIFTPEWECSYQIAHTIHHILTEGIGLRHVCDWIMLMHKHGNNMDVSKVLSYLKNMNHQEAFFALIYIAIRYFNLPPENWNWALLNTSPRRAEELFDYIMKSGNFGRQSSIHHDHHTLSGNLRNLKSYISQNKKFYWLCPSEVRWFIITRTLRYFKKKQQRKHF